MDFDTLLRSNSATNNGASETDGDVIKRRLHGSGFLKQESSSVGEDELRAFKLAKTNSSQMLCFSSPSPFCNGASDAVTGYGYGGMNSTSMQSGVRGPFTPSQWMELEHQALIYKYITANVPIPSYLLNPIRKALESSGFSCFSLLRPNALGWGGFHLGFFNTDPEPGRCRRTDGKKWRCSRDAVPDQKYCERHVNRGRHRSRKPVEGQPGHSVTEATTTVVPDGGAPPHHQQTKTRPPSNDLQSGETCIIQRSVVDKESGRGPKREFGLVCSDSLLNPLNRRSSLVNNRSYENSDTKSENVFVRLPPSWPDRTELSISIPADVSPLRLSRENENGAEPSSWQPSAGGPLGEALHTTSECKNPKALNLIQNWDHSPCFPPCLHSLML